MSLTLKLAYGYPKVGASGEQEVVWAGAGDLTLSSDVGAEVAGSAATAFPLIKKLHESFQGKESVVGLGAYNASAGPRPHPRPHPHPRPRPYPRPHPHSLTLTP